MALQILFNSQQKRLNLDRLPLIAKGQEFEPDVLRSGAWIEPTQNRVLLEPYCLTPDWLTSNSGNYAKLALSDFTASGTWETRVQSGFTAGPWLGIADSAASGSLITTATLVKNRGMWVAAFVYGLSGNPMILDGGWNSSVSSASGIAFEVYLDGTVIFYKAGAEVQRGRVKVQKGKPIELTLIPYAHREILVHCLDSENPNGNGGGFSVVFQDIAEDASDPEITPASKFWLRVPSGATQVMAAPLLFPTSGYVTTVEQSFIDAPASTDVLEEWVNDSWVGAGPTYPYRVYGHPAYVGTQSASFTARDWAGSSFTANGSNIEARGRLTLTSSVATHTPTLYGAQLAYAATFADTDDSEEYDATDHCLSFSLSVPEAANGVTATAVFRDPEVLEANIPNFKRAVNTPIKVIYDGVVLLDGRGGQPVYTSMATDGASRVELEIRDGYKGMEDYTYAEMLPFDDLAFTGVLPYLASHAGIEGTNTTISTATFTLPWQTTGNVDGWSVLAEPGDSPADWADRLNQDYAATWVMGIRPTAAGMPEFFALDPADVGTTPLVILWRSDTDSADPTKGNHTGADIPRFVYHVGNTEETLEPEATEVRVSGYNPITGRMIQAVKVDTAAETVTTAPSSRPANWIGAKRRFGLENSSITRQDVCNQATEIIFDRITPVRSLVQADVMQLLRDPADDRPLWRADVIRLEGRGIFKITSFGAEFELIDSGGYEVVNSQYVLEKIAPEPS